jgi:glucose-1-phosphate thymidylyltransferase
MEAGHFIQTIEKRQGFKIACLEEIAFSKGWIDSITLAEQAKSYIKTGYGLYLKKVLETHESN